MKNWATISVNFDFEGHGPHFRERQKNMAAEGATQLSDSVHLVKSIVKTEAEAEKAFVFCIGQYALLEHQRQQLLAAGRTEFKTRKKFWMAVHDELPADTPRGSYDKFTASINLF